MTKVLLIDDHGLCRQSLAAHLLGCPGIERVLELDDPAGAVRVLSRERADVVLLSMDLPEGRAFEAARAIRRVAGDTRILFLGERAYDADIEEALAVPAAGILLKRDSLACLCAAIHTVVGGGTFFSESIRSRLEEVGGRLKLARPGSPAIGSLSPREQELLVHLGRGASLKEAATAMGISYKTADSQKASLMRKLDIHDRVELAHFAIREGLVSLAPH